MNTLVAAQRGQCGLIGGRNHRPAQEPEKYSQVTVVMSEVGFSGLVVRVGFMGKGFVPILMMAEVLHGLSFLVPAIISHCRPGYLERKQAQHKEHNKASHDPHYNFYGRNLSMAKQSSSIYRPF